MGDVLIILDAEVLHDFGVLKQGRMAVERERPGISAGVVDGDFIVQVTRIGPAITLDYVKLLGMRMADAIEPKLVVESHRVYDERVSIPFAAGIAEPTGIEVLGMGAAVHEDLAVGMHVSFDQEDDQLGSLDNLERKRRLARNARGQATRVGVVFREALLAELQGPRL